MHRQELSSLPILPAPNWNILFLCYGQAVERASLVLKANLTQRASDEINNDARLKGFDKGHDEINSSFLKGFKLSLVV